MPIAQNYSPFWWQYVIILIDSQIMIMFVLFPVMEDDKTLADYNLTASNAKAQQPAEVGLAFRGEEGGWEELEKTPYSIPPELPDVMKPGQDSVAQEQTVA